MRPISLHPQNPRYFLYDSKPLALITSTEHFGGLINLDFDYRKYLSALAQGNFTLTQTWTGAYVEPDSDVGPYNTLDPRNGRYIAPWARSGMPGNAKGGNKFDLSEYNASFFSRLVDFVDTAATHGIIVEVGLFGGYEQTHESIFEVCPFHPSNNVNVKVGSVNRSTVYTLDAPAALREYQVETARRIATALRDRPNVYYRTPVGLELCSTCVLSCVLLRSTCARMCMCVPHAAELVNVPNHSSPEWGVPIRKALLAADPHKLIAVPAAWARAGFSNASIINYGAFARPSDATSAPVAKAALAYDESGGLSGGRTSYRHSYWRWMLSGGSVVDNLDWSFMVGYETGDLPAEKCHEAANAGKAIRTQLAVLSTFFHELPFVKMVPSVEWIVDADTPPLHDSVQGLILAGGGPYPYEGAFAAGFVAVGGVHSIGVRIDAGRCTGVEVEWVDTKSGRTTRALVPPHPSVHQRTIAVPPYEDDVAFRLSCLS